MVKGIKNSPRDILNEIKWTKDLKKAEIWYIHRGAPNDTKIISGGDIVDIGKSFFDTSNGSIPYHRIIKIIYDKKILFSRK
jgi:uncharacterized protein (UPF0248 family)